jgi:hypothetical protein
MTYESYDEHFWIKYKNIQISNYLHLLKGKKVEKYGDVIHTTIPNA